MKKSHVARALICSLFLFFVSCSVHELDTKNTFPSGDEVFYASLESYSEPETKVYVDENVKILWDEDDRITIFNKYTYNQEYRFAGETGDNAGAFKKVPNDDFVTGNSIDHIYAIYPFIETTKISNKEVMTITLPSEQSYRENSFGPGANVMTSATEDNNLLFKNVGGYLVLKFYGEGVSVSSIKLEGNNGELLSGKATVTHAVEGVPSVTMATDAGTSITLNCPTPVELGTTKEDATLFWLVVPPTKFTGGFTLTVMDANGGEFVKKTTANLTIARNGVLRISPIEVKPVVPLDPNKVIYYTSSDNSVITPNAANAFGATIVSNDYVDQKGVMIFDADVTTIGDHAFENCETLTGITIPKTVTIIGDYAFSECTNLGASGTRANIRTGETSIIIPEGVTSIGDYAFQDCTNLTSITIPDTVTSIGDGAFSGCNNLADIDIPDSVKDMGVKVFDGCTSLTSVTIPDGVKRIDDYAFAGCENLISVDIPSSVTSIGKHAFDDCENLVSITLPDGVTRIEAFAFAACMSLPSINFPSGLKSIGSSAFESCFVLANVTLPSGIEDIGSFAFASCHAFTSFSIPPRITRISDGLFSSCSRLSSISIHEDVESIGYMAFSSCSSLTSISIPESVTAIDENAFSESGLTSITIPKNVTSIGNWAFRDCSQLTSFTVLSVTPPVIPHGNMTEGLFQDSNDFPIYVPAESFAAYKEADDWKNYASRIHIIAPASGKINGHAFVDLGNGLKWATMNVGAESETEYGNLYAWGKTEPRVFDPDYVYDYNTAFVDVATSEWGQNWRYPTVQEWDALTDLSKFTWTWDSVNRGYTVESKIPGYLGNKIFLPAAGELGEPENDNFLAGDEGCYWSSSIGDSGPSAWQLNFWVTSGEDPEERFVATYAVGVNGGAGLSIRPVSD